MNEHQKAGSQDMKDFIVVLASICVIITTICCWFSNGNKTEAQTTIEAKEPPVDDGFVKENFVRLFYHQKEEYSIIKINEDKSIVFVYFGMYDVRNLGPSFKIICDVPIGKPMWYEGHRKPKFFGGWKDLELHIHSPTDINGGGWDEGKHGKGQTNVIE